MHTPARPWPSDPACAAGVQARQLAQRAVKGTCIIGGMLAVGKPYMATHAALAGSMHTWTTATAWGECRYQCTRVAGKKQCLAFPKCYAGGLDGMSWACDESAAPCMTKPAVPTTHAGYSRDSIMYTQKQTPPVTAVPYGRGQYQVLPNQHEDTAEGTCIQHAALQPVRLCAHAQRCNC